jgi:hypothetical protein
MPKLLMLDEPIARPVQIEDTGRIERFLLPCGARLLLRMLQGKQSATDTCFASAAWLVRRPVLGGSGEADSDFTFTLEQGAEDGQPQ